MRFSLNFIKEFFNPNLSPEGVAQRLTTAGLEIENVEKVSDDYVFEAEVTPNRYDWLSIFGIANELACLCKTRLKAKLPLVKKGASLKGLSIFVENKKVCSVYIARLIRGIKTDKSPVWLKERVVNGGIKSINNAVDITNYCMLKWGNPLHAFDFDKIKGNIHVRTAKNKETFVGLDDKEYVLTPRNLVISDDDKIIALAGVMGAKNTEVDSNTRNILLEAAVFSPLAIRRSRRSANLDTDSSYRFERNVSSKLLDVASFDAARLLCEVCGGKMSGYSKIGKRPLPTNKTIVFPKTDLDSYIGLKFPKKEVKRILFNLGFEIKIDIKDIIHAKAPFFRKDIFSKEDIFEEIARCYGYENIEPALPLLRPQLQERGLYEFKKQIRAFLLRLGLDEIVTYSINSAANLKSLGEPDFIKLENPLRNEADALRTTLLLGMMEVIKYNFNQKNTALKLFEIADVYKKNKKGFAESPSLSCAVTNDAGGFFLLKGVAEEIIRFLSIEDAEFTKVKKVNFLNAVNIVCKQKVVGFIGQIAPNVKQMFDIKSAVSFLKFDINAVALLKKTKAYRTFSRFPTAYRDISIGLSRGTEFKDIESAIKKTAIKFLYNYKIIDVYKAKDIPGNLHVFTLRIFYNSQYKTLTAKAVDDLHFKLREELSQREGIVLR